MLLVGETSGAQATVNDIRLVSDSTGCVQGCYYIPPNTFQDGENTSQLVEIKPEDQIPGKNFSNATQNFFSEGFEITETTVIRTEPALPEPVVINVTNVVNNVTNVIQPPPEQDNNDDPLAQSFEVTDDPGIFMTSVDMFFQSKAAGSSPQGPYRSSGEWLSICQGDEEQ